MTCVVSNVVGRYSGTRIVFWSCLVKILRYPLRTCHQFVFFCFLHNAFTLIYPNFDCAFDLRFCTPVDLDSGTRIVYWLFMIRILCYPLHTSHLAVLLACNMRWRSIFRIHCCTLLHLNYCRYHWLPVHHTMSLTHSMASTVSWLFAHVYNIF